MTAVSHWRQAYRLLRTNCGLTHHEVRAIFAAHLGGLSFHRNLLANEMRKDKDSWNVEAQSFALMLRSDKVSQFIRSLNGAIWNDDGDAELCYTLVREITALVMKWNEWGEDERLLIRESTKRLLENEKKSGLNKWTERHLLTYLRINGIAIEV